MTFQPREGRLVFIRPDFALAGSEPKPTQIAGGVRGLPEERDGSEKLLTSSKSHQTSGKGAGQSGQPRRADEDPREPDEGHEGDEK